MLRFIIAAAVVAAIVGSAVSFAGRSHKPGSGSYIPVTKVDPPNASLIEKKYIPTTNDYLVTLAVPLPTGWTATNNMAVFKVPDNSAYEDEDFNNGSLDGARHNYKVAYSQQMNCLFQVTYPYAGDQYRMLVHLSSVPAGTGKIVIALHDYSAFDNGFPAYDKTDFWGKHYPADWSGG